MKLHQLKYFIKVCESLNITKAAKKLHMSQPSLTVSIKSLEQELGVNLFRRENHKISLTPEGQVFKDRLRPILKDLDALKREIVSTGVHNMVLRIGIPPMLGAFLFPMIFSKFTSEYPEVKLEIVEHNPTKLQKLLLDEKIDLAFLINENQMKQDIVFIPIYVRELHLYVNKDHALAKAKQVGIEDLSDLPLVTFNSEFHINSLIMENFSQQGIRPNIIFETSQINTIAKFIRENMASSILLDGCIPENTEVISISIDEIQPITIGLARKKDHFLTNSAKTMIKFFS